nr:MAG TPA: hypothetical protein [Caudoviricetes sp.]
MLPIHSFSALYLSLTQQQSLLPFVAFVAKIL